MDADLEDLQAIPTQNLFFKRQECLVPVVDDEPFGESRFGSPLRETELKEKIDNSISKKTKGNNNWALGVYKEWRMWRNFKAVSKADPNWPIPALDNGEKV